RLAAAGGQELHAAGGEGGPCRRRAHAAQEVAARPVLQEPLELLELTFGHVPSPLSRDETPRGPVLAGHYRAEPVPGQRTRSLAAGVVKARLPANIPNTGPRKGGLPAILPCRDSFTTQLRRNNGPCRPGPGLRSGHALPAGCRGPAAPPPAMV